MHIFKVGDWCYGQIVDIDDLHDGALVEFNTERGGGSMHFGYDELKPAKAPTKLVDLPQYHFDRDEFCKAFEKVFTNDELIDMELECGCNKHVGDFALMRHDDEFYILHRDSGIMINWYKHLGRTNTCNRPDFTLDDLREFLKKLREELVWERVIDDEALLRKMQKEFYDGL